VSKNPGTLCWVNATDFFAYSSPLAGSRTLVARRCLPTGTAADSRQTCRSRYRPAAPVRLDLSRWPFPAWRPRQFADSLRAVRTAGRHTLCAHGADARRGQGYARSASFLPRRSPGVDFRSRAGALFRLQLMNVQAHQTTTLSMRCWSVKAFRFTRTRLASISWRRCPHSVGQLCGAGRDFAKNKWHYLGTRERSSLRGSTCADGQKHQTHIPPVRGPRPARGKIFTIGADLLALLVANRKKGHKCSFCAARDRRTGHRARK